MQRVLSNVWYMVNDPGAFSAGALKMLATVPSDGVFAGDNLITFGKNLSFLSSPKFMDALVRNQPDEAEVACMWRKYVLCWAAKSSLRLEGDFVEAGTYRGHSAKMICDYVDFNTSGKAFYLYDLFEHDDAMPHHGMPAHGKDLYGKVVGRFAGYPGVHVVKGRVPDSFEGQEPERIAFLHVDLNNTEAELGVLNRFFDRVVPGGIVIFDDYGWALYAQQKAAEDAWLAARGHEPLELPTGQGLLIKR
ncbi:MAG TPA: class I SAM-dependent methyltransferase [Alphaproteobacteria bacterium]|nr:class I SAM-dependent methyltransferase [Alphaproteobacteria bacterium]